MNKYLMCLNSQVIENAENFSIIARAIYLNSYKKKVLHLYGKPMQFDC